MQYAIVNEAGKFFSMYGWRGNSQGAMLFRTKEEAEQNAATLPHQNLKAVGVLEAVPGAPPDGMTQIFGIKAKPNV
jgi:hypothetical protein